MFAFLGQSRVSLGTVLGMLILDAVIFSVLAWYLGQVVPSAFGIQKHPLFFLSQSFWQGILGREDGTTTSTTHRHHSAADAAAAAAATAPRHRRELRSLPTPVRSFAQACALGLVSETLGPGHG